MFYGCFTWCVCGWKRSWGGLDPVNIVEGPIKQLSITEPHSGQTICAQGVHLKAGAAPGCPHSKTAIGERVKKKSSSLQGLPLSTGAWSRLIPPINHCQAGQITKHFPHSYLPPFSTAVSLTAHTGMLLHCRAHSHPAASSLVNPRPARRPCTGSCLFPRLSLQSAKSKLGRQLFLIC